MKTHAELLREYGNAPITYPVLLLTIEWRERRAFILDRDGHKCRRCGCSGGEHPLQIHHEHYIVDRLPWQYPDELLVAFCDPCHKSVHHQHQVYVYEEIGGKLVRRNLTRCSRCSGTGYFPQWDHIQGGIWFRCNGTRFEKIEMVESPWTRTEHTNETGRCDK